MERISDLIEKKFEKFHSQKTVILKMMEYGLSVKSGRVMCNDVEVDTRSLAEACNVDFRVVKSAVANVMADRELTEIFTNLKSTLHMGGVAPHLGMGEIVIEPNNAREAGIIFEVARVLWQSKISIRQAIGDDPDFVENPRLYIITDSPIPPGLIPEMKKSEKIKSVTIY